MGPTAWRVAAAYVTGSSHGKLGQPCQDAHHWVRLPDGWLLGAVADGAGSAKLGEVGADVATRTAVATLRQELDGAGPAQGWDEARWRGLLTRALQAARDAVAAEAATRGAAVRELATTLLLVVAAPDRVAAAQIGDGAVVLGDHQGRIQGLTTPKAGEYINETVFLVSPGALAQAQTAVWEGEAAHLAAFSDGLQMLALKMPGGSPHGPFFEPLFRFVEQAGDEDEASRKLGEFLQSPRLRERTDDDLTLLLAARVDRLPGEPCSGAGPTDKS